MENWVDKEKKERERWEGKEKEGERKDTLESPHKHCESRDSQPKSEGFLNDPRQRTTASWNESCGQYRDQPNLTE